MKSDAKEGMRNFFLQEQQAMEHMRRLEIWLKSIGAVRTPTGDFVIYAPGILGLHDDVDGRRS